MGITILSGGLPPKPSHAAAAELAHEALLHFVAALAHEFEHFGHLRVLVEEFVDFADRDAGADGDVEEVPGGGWGIDKYGSTGEESMHVLVLWAILRTLSALSGEVRLVVRRNEMMQEARLPGIAGSVRSRAHVWRHRAATIAVGSLAMVMGYGVVFGHNGLTAFASKRREARTLQLQMQQL